jgi:hypothetical protein
MRRLVLSSRAADHRRARRALSGEGRDFAFVRAAVLRKDQR